MVLKKLFVEIQEALWYVCMSACVCVCVNYHVLKYGLVPFHQLEIHPDNQIRLEF